MTSNNNGDVHQLSNTLYLILLSKNHQQGSNSNTPKPGPSPGPGPEPDPLHHIISLFDSYLKSTFPQTGIPGAAVVIVQNGKIVYMNCLGVRDLTSKKPVDPNTLFMIGSNTKQFTATNIAQLVSAGLMSWDDPITKYYPNLTSSSYIVIMLPIISQ